MKSKKQLVTKDNSWNNLEDLRRNRFEKVFKHLPYRKGGIGLNVGGTSGTYSFIKDNCGLKRLIQMNVRYQDVGKEDVIIANVENGLPFKNNYFDFIFMGEILEHINNVDFLLEEVRRVMKSNGITLITTPNGANLFDRILFFFGKLPQSYHISNKYIVDRIGGNYESPFGGYGHMKLFTFKALEDLLELNGFKILESDSYWNSEKGRPYHIFRWLSQFLPKRLQEGIILKIKKVK